MARSDRLFELIQILRDGRLHKGRDLAERLGVSLRTLYRDMDRLIGSGLPVEGERGLGYIMTAPITLPPLNLTLTELEALHLGLAVVTRSADPELRAAAAALSDKVDDALPEDRSAPRSTMGLAAYPFAEAARGFIHMAPLRGAIRARRKLLVVYATSKEAEVAVVIRPLQLEYWGRLWSVTAWCEDSEGFLVIRVDRIRMLDVLHDSFEEEPGKRLTDYLDGLDTEATKGPSRP